MVDRRRRRATAAAALSLAFALGACGENGAAHASAPAAETAPAPERPRLDGSVRERVERAVSDVVGRWTADAERRSQGRAPRSKIRVSVHVSDLASGQELVALRADEARMPASNMKLATTAAALVLLGARAEFRTPLEAAGPLDSGVLRGDLVVRAGGDPLVLPDGSGAAEGRLLELARELRARGLERVSGDLVLDEGNFLVPAPGPEWPSADQHWQAYCALSSGLSIHGGVIQAVVTPSQAGARARVEVHPLPHGLRSSIDVLTTAGGKIDVRVGASASTATVRGTIPAGTAPFTAEFAHPDPPLYFGNVLAAELERAGIALEGSVRRERGASGGALLGELRSRVADTLSLINAESKNSVADQLFLALGWQVSGRGDREGGSAATRAALERLGVSTAGFAQVDGSGLSRANRLTTRQLSSLVAAVIERGEDEAQLFRASLAVSGASGTLAERMLGTAAEGRVHGKTGWISGVSALSGLAETLSERELAFSILVEYPPEAGGLNTSSFKPMEDEILSVLVAEGP